MLAMVPAPSLAPSPTRSMRYNTAIRWGTRDTHAPGGPQPHDPQVQPFGLPFETVVAADLRAFNGTVYGPDGRAERRADRGEMLLATRRMTAEERDEVLLRASLAWVPLVGPALGALAVWLRRAWYVCLYLAAGALCALVGAVVGLFVDPRGAGAACGLAVGASVWLLAGWALGRPSSQGG